VQGLVIGVARDPADIEAVRALWRQYWDALGLAPEFQGFAEELRTLPGLYGEPGGLLLLARIGAAPAGTIALRRLSKQAAEAKRLFVAPEFRGRGLASALLARLIADARALGYASIFGDTLPSMREAQTLYRNLGFREAGPYSATPTPGAIYMELALTSSSSEPSDTP
jgi:putative acetyltransferase